MRMRPWILLLLLGLAACGREVLVSGRLMPPPTATPSGQSLPLQPASLTLAQLNDMPEAYEDRYLRLSGALRRLPVPGCSPYRGPGTSWTLVEDELRLDGRGLADILLLVPRDTVVTLDGVWRRYIGPLGCGKEPAAGQSWYLEAMRIVAPNPLPGYGPLPEATDGAGSGLLGPPPVLATVTPDLGATLAATATAGPSVTASATLPPTPSQTPGTTTPTLPPTHTPTPTRPPTRTPLVSDTPGPSPTPSVTPNLTLTATPEATSPGGGFATATPGPPAPTFTPGTPYPGPTPLPTWPGGYP